MQSQSKSKSKSSKYKSRCERDLHVFEKACWAVIGEQGKETRKLVTMARG